MPLSSSDEVGLIEQRPIARGSYKALLTGLPEYSNKSPFADPNLLPSVLDIELGNSRAHIADGGKKIYIAIHDIHDQFIIPLTKKIIKNDLLGRHLFLINYTTTTIQILQAITGIVVATISVKSLSQGTNILAETGHVPPYYDDLYIDFMLFEKDGEALRHIFFLFKGPPNFHLSTGMKPDQVSDLRGNLGAAQIHIFNTLRSWLRRYLLTRESTRLFSPPFML
jgi:hypothetical protein